MNYEKFPSFSMQKETSMENDQISDEKKYLHFFCSVKGLYGHHWTSDISLLKKSVIWN